MHAHTHTHAYTPVCTQELLGDYKQELSEILANDKQLAAELTYDLKQVTLRPAGEKK